MIKKLLILIIATVLVTSCFKEDEKILPHDPGEVVTAVIPLTQYYTNQVYYSLGQKEIVSINVRSIFDLNFSCNDTSTIIRLNTANFAKAAKTNFDELEDVVDTTGLIWKFDKSDGNIDSIAFSNWINIMGEDTNYSKKVWVIDRGIDAMGNGLGLKKIQFNSLTNGKFYFTYSNMDNTGIVEDYVEKDDDYFYLQYSLLEENIMQTEPSIDDWDLLFTQYTTMLFTSEGLSYPYLVTGVLQKLNIGIALDTSLVFNDIKIGDTTSFSFSDNTDKIGYDWKELVGDVTTGDIYYEIKINNNYIIRDNYLFYYKLRFINFYDPETGEKGYPAFEFQKL